MNIGIDARFFGERGQGLARYTERYVSWLCAQTSLPFSFTVFVRSIPRVAIHNKKIRFVRAPFRWYTLAEQTAFLRMLQRSNADLMHFLHFNVPLLYRKKFIATIHDLILINHAGSHNSARHRVVFAVKEMGYRLVLNHTVMDAESLITVSEYTKNDILKNFSRPANTIFTINNGLDQPLSANQETPPGEPLPARYLLYVGNAYPHKNVSWLITNTLLWIKQHKDFHLILAGKRDHFWREIAKRFGTHAPTMHILYDMSDSQLAYLYRHALVYVTASLCEGFGLTPLEAMTYNTPVLASNRSALPEILGSGALFFDPDSPTDFHEKLTVISLDEGTRLKLNQNARGVIKKYTWESMGAQILDLYRSRQS